MPLDLPSVQSLNDMQFLPTGLNLMAGQNMGLQQQYSQGALQEQAANLQAQSLKNMFNEQNNPQLVESQRLSNIGSGNANTISGVNADLATGTKDEAMAAKKQKFLAEADEDTLKSLAAQGEALSVKGAGLGDADMEAKGKRMIEASAKAIAAKNAQGSKEDVARQVSEAKLEGIRVAGGLRNEGSAATDASRERIAALKAKGMNKATDILSAMQQGKMGYEKAASAFEVMSSMEPDPDLAAKYASLATKFAAARDADVTKLGGKVDLDKMGVDVTQFKSPLGTSAGMNAAPPSTGGTPVAGPTNTTESGMARDIAPLIARVNSPQEAMKEIQDTTAMLPSMAPKDRANAQQYIDGLKQKFGGQPKATAPVGNIPAGAAQMLKGNPALAAAFDQKYGPGSAKSILGQ